MTNEFIVRNGRLFRLHFVKDGYWPRKAWLDCGPWPRKEKP